MEQHWRSPAQTGREEHNKITGLQGKKTRGKVKTKTYLKKPSLWFKRIVFREQEDVFLFEFGPIVPAVLNCLFRHN